MRRQLVLVALATTVTVAVAFVVPLAILVRLLAAQRALADADQVIRALIPVLVTGEREAVTVAVQQVDAATDAAVAVHLEDGTVLGTRDADPDVAVARTGRAVDRAEPGGGRTRLTPVVSQRGGTSVIRVAVPSSSLTAGVATAWWTLLGVGLALVAIAVAIADRLGRRVVTQAGAVASAARRLAAGDRQARAPTEGAGPELADAARALNALADRIDALRAAEREAAADLSHRLRTPMTALRLDVEALPTAEATERVLDDLAALDAAVDRVIRSARGAGGDDGRAVTDAARVVRERSDFWAALAQDEQRAWTCTCAPGVHRVPLDEERLTAVVDALLGNVLSHTDPPAGCRIAVDRTGDGVRIRVDDDGPGFPAAAAARGRSGGGSTGLGLDIARRTAESVGGHLRIGGRDDGGRVDLVLPALS